jgi:hypothetical protein
VGTASQDDPPTRFERMGTAGEAGLLRPKALCPVSAPAGRPVTSADLAEAGWDRASTAAARSSSYARRRLSLVLADASQVAAVGPHGLLAPGRASYHRSRVEEESLERLARISISYRCGVVRIRLEGGRTGFIAVLGCGAPGPISSVRAGCRGRALQSRDPSDSGLDADRRGGLLHGLSSPPRHC